MWLSRGNVDSLLEQLRTQEDSVCLQFTVNGPVFRSVSCLTPRGERHHIQVLDGKPSLRDIEYRVHLLKVAGRKNTVNTQRCLHLSLWVGGGVLNNLD